MQMSQMKFEVLEVLKQHGEVISHDVEDMKEQYEIYKAKQKQNE